MLTLNVSVIIDIHSCILQGLYSSEVDDSLESSWFWILKLKDEIYTMAYQVSTILKDLTQNIFA